MGIGIIIYIDDILVMAESKTLLKDHVAGIIYLLEKLGFVINFPKSLLELHVAKVIDFLGFLLDSAAMELKLLSDKIKNLWGETRTMLTAKHITALDLSRLLGIMNATTQVITMTPLFYQQLHIEQVVSEVWSSDIPLRHGEGGASVVDQSLNKLEWAEPHIQETECLPGAGDGCLASWLGSSMRGIK